MIALIPESQRPAFTEGRFLGEFGIEAAALDHEPVDHAVKNGVVVMSVCDILQKILDGFRSFLVKQFQLNIAH